MSHFDFVKFALVTFNVIFTFINRASYAFVMHEFTSLVFAAYHTVNYIIAFKGVFIQRFSYLDKRPVTNSMALIAIAKTS